jgi:hypothetical protein
MGIAGSLFFSDYVPDPVDKAISMPEPPLEGSFFYSGSPIAERSPVK